MTGPVLLDTGPLVSFLSGEQEHSDWVVAQWKRLRPPLLTCEARRDHTAARNRTFDYDHPLAHTSHHSIPHRKGLPIRTATKWELTGDCALSDDLMIGLNALACPF